MKLYTLLCIFFLFLACGTTHPPITTDTPSKEGDPFVEKTKNLEKWEGFFTFWWDEQAGKIWLEIKALDTEFLYINSLPAGVGSNDIGLDRGQLSGERIVKFIKSGPKLLLIQPNYDFRAISDNTEERKSVEEAFAQSVLWGFTIEAAQDDRMLVDATAFLLRDAHGVANTLKMTKQGSYKLDASRSAIYLPRCKSFPKNTEFEAMLTFTGKPEGSYVRDVVPSADAITVRMHHSFVELPDDDYVPRVFDPRSGYYSIYYKDYATPIDQPLMKRLITRHRLKKKNPASINSEAVEPIIYYVDRGAPEPIRSALIEGASWWNQAFEAAGYRNAFQVKILPDDADPMDVRYNLIQWVHRSTRGWSYGSTVIDPRTGEIIKGHVSLGSLRVRQDFLIAQGLVAAYEEGKAVNPELERMALARLRQLSAHEVGHTLGLTHNFAASTNGRASVMDYPHPYLTLRKDGGIDFSKAYDDKIGAWDKRAILYGYKDFENPAQTAKGLQNILEETIAMGLRHISDSDARPKSGAHPYAHLWDNGADAVAELERLLAVREKALQQFGAQNLPEGRPLAELEEVLAPLYLAHRYQVEAVAKLIGGVDYTYAVRGDGQEVVAVVSAEEQRKAIDALLSTLTPAVLQLPENIQQLIPPKPIGYWRGRESFKSRTGPLLDPLAMAESAAHHSLRFLLDRSRANRLLQQHSTNLQIPSLGEVLNRLIDITWRKNYSSPQEQSINRMLASLVLQHLMQLAAHQHAASQVRAISWLKIEQLEQWLQQQLSSVREEEQRALYRFALLQIAQFRQTPKRPFGSEAPQMPDGSPIGMDACEGLH